VIEVSSAQNMRSAAALCAMPYTWMRREQAF
jgi:hypothetical protein